MNLSMSKRQMMPSSDFAMPDHRFPISDPTHARLAIGGATRAAHAGHISGAQEATIKAKARAKLGMSAKDAMVQKLRSGK